MTLASSSKKKTKNWRSAVKKEFVAPELNAFSAEWYIPKPERLVEILKFFAGDIKKLLSEVCKKEQESDLLFVINESLSHNEAREHKREWERLKTIHAQTAIEYTTLDVARDMGRPVSERTTVFGQNAKRISDLKSLQEIVTRGAKEKSKKTDPEVEALLKSMDALKSQMEDAQDLPDCQAQDDND